MFILLQQKIVLRTVHSLKHKSCVSLRYALAAACLGEATVQPVWKHNLEAKITDADGEIFPPSFFKHLPETKPEATHKEVIKINICLINIRQNSKCNT